MAFSHAMGAMMNRLLNVFWSACRETPRGYFAPVVALWQLFRDTADAGLIKR